MDVNSSKDTIGQIDVNVPNWQSAIKRKRSSGRSRLDDILEVDIYAQFEVCHVFIISLYISLLYKIISYIKIEFVNGRIIVFSQLITNYDHPNPNHSDIIQGLSGIDGQKYHKLLLL